MRGDQLLASACLAGVAACLLLPVSNPDLFWHLNAARRIVALGALPTADWLSWTFDGRPWTDFEWLAQLVWLAAYNLGGGWALLGMKAAALAGAGAALAASLRLHAFPPAAVAGCLLAWALALMPANDLRPENFSLLLFGVEWWALERARLGRPVATGSPAALLAAAYFSLWANLHAGFMMGLALLAFYVPSGRARSWAGLCVAAAAGTLLTPHGPKLYTVHWEHARVAGDLSRLLQEWGAPTLTDPWLAPFWLLLAAAACAAIAGRGALPRAHALALLFFGVSALRHARTVPYFAAVAVPVAALLLRERMGTVSPRLRSAPALALVLYAVLRVVPQLSAVPLAPRATPEGVARFLELERETLAPKRLFQPWRWGGYLGWRLAPDYRVFADGRYIFHELLQPMEDARREPEAFQAFLDGWGVDVVVLEREKKFVDVPADLPDGSKPLIGRPSYLFFLPRPSWALIYWDEQGLVFVRRAAVSAAWLAPREFKRLRADDEEALELMVRKGLVPPGELAAERERFAAIRRAFRS